MAGENTPGEQTHGHGYTTTRAWTAVLLMIIGFGLCVLALPWRDARLPLLITGVALGLAGVVLAKVSNIMDMTE